MKSEFGDRVAKDAVALGAVALVTLLAAAPALGANAGVGDGPPNPAAPRHRNAVGGGAVSSGASQGEGEGPWGAIAYWRFGSQWLAGGAANYLSPHWAELAAREQCGDLDACNVAVTFQNECGALAVSVLPAPLGHVVMGWANARAEIRAREAALGKCRNEAIDRGGSCQVEISVCSGDAGDAGSAWSSELPPEIELDRLMLLADQALEEQDARSARVAMEGIQTLQQRHNLEPAPEDFFLYAELWRLAGDAERAEESLTQYLQVLGRDATRYWEALDLLNQAEDGTLGRAVGGTPPRVVGSLDDIWFRWDDVGQDVGSVRIARSVYSDLFMATGPGQSLTYTVEVENEAVARAAIVDAGALRVWPVGIGQTTMSVTARVLGSGLSATQTVEVVVGPEATTEPSGSRPNSARVSPLPPEGSSSDPAEPAGETRSAPVGRGAMGSFCGEPPDEAIALTADCTDETKWCKTGIGPVGGVMGVPGAAWATLSRVGFDIGIRRTDQESDRLVLCQVLEQMTPNVRGCSPDGAMLLQEGHSRPVDACFATVKGGRYQVWRLGVKRDPDSLDHLERWLLEP